jgi:DNA-binding FadR family transcriptional regulator
VLDVTTYDERAGLINPFRPEDRDAIQRLVREKLVTAARESGILVHADRSADRVLTELLARDGYSVKIVRPMVVNRPKG